MDKGLAVPNLSHNELTAVYRAAAGKTETRTDRLRRAREIQATEQRRQRAAALIARVDASLDRLEDTLKRQSNS